MRKRINTRAIVSVDPSNPTDYYRVSKKAHKESLASSHNEFVASGLNTAFMAVAKPIKHIKEMSAQEIRLRFKEYCFFNIWLPVRKKSDYELDNLKLTIENWR